MRSEQGSRNRDSVGRHSESRHRVRHYLACLLTVASFTAAADGSGPDIRMTVLTGIEYSHAREALEDAIAEEGLVSPVISYFGDMIARTAADLGHRGDTYRDAHVYTFCSVSAAARLASEDPGYIALCPLSIGIYQTPDDQSVKLVYRPTGLETAGGRMASDTQARIVSRTRSLLGLD